MGELSVRELPIFPLPEVVLFPQEVLPLHIFESRYRIMLQSVLETDSMFGIIKWDPCLLYTSPSPRDTMSSRMPSSA